jgi:diguanylate cyclase (GGDEF)-like protein
MEETLAHHATHDPLTDLPNRAICDNVLQLALARARRRGGLVALLHLDLDRFRVINDTLGHEVGDMLLRQVAMRLAGSLRESEVPSRTGGDKFVVVLSELDDPEAAAGVAQRVIDALSAPYDLRGTEVFVGVSVGVALFPRDGSDVSTLQKSADSAMLAAKKQGKNRVQMFTADMHTAASERLALESELHRALERNELLVHYQPLFDLQRPASSGRKLYRAGRVRNSAACRRPSSFRLPRRAGSLCPSAAGSFARHAGRCGHGGKPATVPFRWPSMFPYVSLRTEIWPGWSRKRSPTRVWTDPA